MQDSDKHTMPDPLDFVPGQKIGDTESKPIDVAQQSTLYAAPKKKSPAKIAINVLTIILLIPIIIIGIIVAVIVGASFSHGHELNKLQDETTSLFNSSSFAASSYDCHDVELRNECFFKLSGSENSVASYLESQGFSPASLHGKGYQKDMLYIEVNDNNSYTSYYVSQ